MFVNRAPDQIAPDNTLAWIRVDDVDSLRAGWKPRLSEDYADTSAPAMTAITERPWGREFAVRDVAGNCVHFRRPRPPLRRGRGRLVGRRIGAGAMFAGAVVANLVAADQILANGDLDGVAGADSSPTAGPGVTAASRNRSLGGTFPID